MRKQFYASLCLNFGIRVRLIGTGFCNRICCRLELLFITTINMDFQSGDDITSLKKLLSAPLWIYYLGHTITVTWFMDRYWLLGLGILLHDGWMFGDSFDTAQGSIFSDVVAFYSQICIINRMWRCSKNRHAWPIHSISFIKPLGKTRGNHWTHFLEISLSQWLLTLWLELWWAGNYPGSLRKLFFRTDWCVTWMLPKCCSDYNHPACSLVTASLRFYLDNWLFIDFLF